jgi:hypothetical protein
MIGISRLVVDYEHGTMTVVMADGYEVTATSTTVPATPLKRATCDLGQRELTLTLPDDALVTVELGSMNTGDEPPPDRPVVYLDQLHWVSLSQCLHAPDRIDAGLREAGQALIALAREERLILPLSAAHLSEAPVGGHQRRDLVTTMLELSRGWQMRSPIAVRQSELCAAFAGTPGPVDGVITLDPGTLFSDPGSGVAPPADFPPDWQEMHARLTGVTALYSAAIEEDSDRSDSRRIAETWAKPHQALATYHRDNKTSKEHVRINTRAYLFGDLRTEIAEAALAVGLDQATLSAWVLAGSAEELQRMPFLGRVHEVLYQRLRNADDHWGPNDLADMHFLPCAAGYTAVLVAEKKTADHLRRAANEVTPGAHVCPRLVDAVEHLRRLGLT